MERLPQPSLDLLAATWSELDRARPPAKSDVPAAITVLTAWMAAAIAVDGLLNELLGPAYRHARSEEPGGQALVGLSHPSRLLAGGHAAGDLVYATDLPQHEFWELYWRPLEELPRLPADASSARQAEAYGEHLAGQPARRPAAAITVFLGRLGTPLRNGG